MPPIRRPDDQPDPSPRRWPRRLAVALGALFVMLASACGGSTAPEPGEHETKHDEATENRNGASLAPLRPRAVSADASSVADR